MRVYMHFSSRIYVFSHSLQALIPSSLLVRDTLLPHAATHIKKTSRGSAETVILRTCRVTMNEETRGNLLHGAIRAIGAT